MKPSESIKPISYLKAHASELIRDVSANQKTLVITQNGEAKVILQDVRVYEQTQESLALLKILAQSSKSLKVGQFKSAKSAFSDLRERVKEHQKQ
ncbi:MAG: type II toxin-antitoxin system Phd/YefM family antitoxin [bacterium]